MLTILIWDNVPVVMFVCSNSVFEAEVKFSVKTKLGFITP